MSLGQGFEGVGESGRQAERLPCAAKGLEGGTGIVGGQIEQRGRVAELLLPVVELLFQGGGWVGLPCGAELLPLPGGVVGVLNGEFRQERGLLTDFSGVEGGHFGHQPPQRPVVGDDVVDGDHQQVGVGFELEQVAAQQRSLGQVKGSRNHGLNLGLHLGLRGLAQVKHR